MSKYRIICLDHLHRVVPLDDLLHHIAIFENKEDAEEYLMFKHNPNPKEENGNSEALEIIDRFVDEINHSEEWIGKDLYSNNHIKLELTKIRSTLEST